MKLRKEIKRKERWHDYFLLWPKKCYDAGQELDGAISKYEYFVWLENVERKVVFDQETKRYYDFFRIKPEQSLIK